MNIQRLLLDNWGLKGVSLLLALLLWVSVSSEQVVERTVSVPVEFLNAPPALEISNDYVRTLDVQVSTRRASLIGGMGAISAVVDLHGAPAGERIVTITEDNIRRPDGVTIVNITPSRIALVLERTWRKLVPVEPQITGTPASGYQMTKAETSPAQVMIMGPESRVRKATKTTTELINIGGATDLMQREVNVDIADSKLRIDRVDPVRVEILIEELRQGERVTVPLMVGPGLRTAARSVQLQVSYPKGYRRPVAPSMFAARVERPAEAVAGVELELQPQIAIHAQPEGVVRVDKVIPDRVKVRVL